MELKKVCEFFASLRRHYPDQVLRVLSQPFDGHPGSNLYKLLLQKYISNIICNFLFHEPLQVY